MSQAESIRDLQKFVASHGKDYAEKHRSTEQDRDSIENEVRCFLDVNVVTALLRFLQQFPFFVRLCLAYNSKNLVGNSA